MQNSVSVSMVKHQMTENGAGLSWNVTAPCRLEAEVWLCKREQPGVRCVEVSGSRQRVHDGWIATRKGHWVRSSRLTSKHQCSMNRYFFSKKKEKTKTYI